MSLENGLSPEVWFNVREKVGKRKTARLDCVRNGVCVCVFVCVVVKGKGEKKCSIISSSADGWEAPGMCGRLLTEEFYCDALTKRQASHKHNMAYTLF